MPQEPNRLLRIAVPVALGIAGLFLAWSVMRNAGPSNPGAPVAPATGAASQPTPTGPSNPGAPPAAAPESPAPSVPVAPPPPPVPGLHAVPVPAEQGPRTPLGVGDPDSLLAVEFDPIGAGIRSLRLTRQFAVHTSDVPVTIQSTSSRTLLTGAVETLVPFSALWVEVNGVMVPITLSASGPVWRETAPGSFECVLDDDGGAPVLRIARQFTLRAGAYGLTLRQTIDNLSGAPLSVRFVQFGPADLSDESSGYGGEKRKVRFGYLFKPALDPTQTVVMSDRFHLIRTGVLGRPDRATGAYGPVPALWPNKESVTDGLTLSWAGMTNRYFGVAIHPVLDAGAQGRRALASVSDVERVVMSGGGPNGAPALAARTASPVLTVAPGASADLSVGVYAGPLSSRIIDADPVASAMGLQGLILYNFGGMCGSCTFAWLTGLLAWMLTKLHDYVVFDWALAIVLLVVFVRLCMHPATRWSQIRMQRFGKQMQAVGPKQKAIQERFKGDSKRIQEETARLWREEGVNPAGMLGCLPMFLVMPVWFALFAMLSFKFELRHTPAFFGVIQKATGGAWGFLSDLSEPDRALAFGRSFNVPLLGSLIGPVSSLNLLPLLLGIVFYVHQQYLTPPPTTTPTPEQEMQQKMVKWMSVIMFPLFMYNAPAGLTIYYTVNSTFAIFENKWIRKHIDAHGLLDVKKKPAGEPTGFLARLQRAAEARAKSLEQSRKSGPPRGKPGR